MKFASKRDTSNQRQRGQHDQADAQAGDCGDYAGDQGTRQLASRGRDHKLPDGDCRGAVAGTHVQ